MLNKINHGQRCPAHFNVLISCARERVSQPSDFYGGREGLIEHERIINTKGIITNKSKKVLTLSHTLKSSCKSTLSTNVYPGMGVGLQSFADEGDIYPDAHLSVRSQTIPCP